MAIELPPLPYEAGALAPHISQRTIETHYGKHHKGYVEKANQLIAGTPMADFSLEEIVRASAEEEDRDLFNNAAQAWNHAFYWRSMKPGGGGRPRGAVADAIGEAFDGYQAFRTAFAEAGETQFGSGYAWLVARGGKLEIVKTANAEAPWIEPGVAPLLTMDVWEHAYYLDRQNDRAAYIAAFLDNLVAWDFAERNLQSAS